MSSVEKPFRLNVESMVIFQWPALKRLGIEHGFIGASTDFSDRALAGIVPNFLEALNLKRLYLTQQVHGDTIVTLRSDLQTHFLKADAIIVDRCDEKKSQGRVAIGVRTADCLPVMFVSDKRMAVCHAGWRGVANGILNKLAGMFEEDFEVFIGPCAGGENYEVGSDVIEAIGESAVFSPVGLKSSESSTSDRVAKGEFMLDLVATARAQVSKHDSGRATCKGFHSSGVCTIADLDFHSYRRQREARGSNLAYLITDVRFKLGAC